MCYTKGKLKLAKLLLHTHEDAKLAGNITLTALLRSQTQKPADATGEEEVSHFTGLSCLPVGDSPVHSSQSTTP